MSLNFEELYNNLNIEFNNYKASNDDYIKDLLSQIEFLKNENKNILNELNEVKNNLKEKNTDLIFLAEQYSKLEEKLKHINKINYHRSDSNINYQDLIKDLLQKEIENIKLEENNYLKNILCEENFCLEFFPKNLINHSKTLKEQINKTNKFKHNLITQDVDEILEKIQKKQENLIMTQKMINLNHVNT
jgi:hypothetical protein